MNTSEIKSVFIGDIALNQDITDSGQKISTGGGAYYSMVGATHVSDHTGIVGKIGTDFNQDVLQRRQVDTRGIKIEPGYTCRFVLTQYSDNTRDFEAQRGVAEFVDTSIFPHAYLAASYIHLATQLPEHALIWQEFLRGHSGVSVDTFEAFIDQYPEQTLQMLEQAEIIFINQAEYQALGLHDDSYPNKTVILKLGKDGVIYRSPTERITLPAPQVPAIETTGAGDVLAGAFLAQLSEGVSTAESLMHAVQIASLSVTAFGVEHILSRKNTKTHLENSIH